MQARIHSFAVYLDTGWWHASQETADRAMIFERFFTYKGSGARNLGSVVHRAYETSRGKHRGEIDTVDSKNRVKAPPHIGYSYLHRSLAESFRTGLQLVQRMIFSWAKKAGQKRFLLCRGYRRTTFAKPRFHFAGSRAVDIGFFKALPMRKRAR